MIRDFSQSDKIKYSKKFIDNSCHTFLFYWFITPEGLFEDVDFYIEESIWHKLTLKAKIFGSICGTLILPFIFLTFILVFSLSKIYDSKLIGQCIILIFFLIPFSLIRFPFSLYTYMKFRANALINILKSD